MSAQTTFTAGDRAFLDNWIYDYNPSQSQSAPLPSNMVVLRDGGGKNGGLNVAVAKLNDRADLAQGQRLGWPRKTLENRDTGIKSVEAVGGETLIGCHAAPRNAVLSAEYFE
jgi:hypothetical protein